MWDPYAEFETATLSNGLMVHAAHWPGRPWEAMGFLIHSGAEYDPVGLEGLSHFVEHVVSENTNVPKKDMCAFFENCGGMVNFGTTNYSCTQYRFFVPADKTVLAKAFSMFGHMLLSAKLEKLVERERQVIVNEFHRNYPIKFSFDLDVREHKALYAGYWLERFVRPLGTPESVGRITEGDLQMHYDTHYTPANISIVGVGGMMLSELIELLSKSPFAITKKGVRTPLPNPATDFSPPLETRYVFEVSKHFSGPIDVCAYRSVTKIPGTINVQAIHIMQKMFDEALDEEVRQKRWWTYAINSSRCNYRNFYTFSISCNTLELRALDGIEKVIEDCIATMGSRENLLQEIKRRDLASNFIVDPTGRGICEGALYDLIDYQRIISLAECSNYIDQLTIRDIRSLLQWLRPEWRWTLITRP